MVALVATPESVSAKKRRKSVGQFYSEARQQYDKGNDKTAIKTLKKLTKSYSNFKPAYMLMGLIYYENGQLKKSYRAFKKGSRVLVDKDNGFAYGVANISHYNYKNAIAGFKKVSKNSEAYPYAVYYLGVSFYNRKMWFKAKQYFMKPAISKLPSIYKETEKGF